MALKSVGLPRFLLALVLLQVASACGGSDTPPPAPPPEDTTAPITRASPPGGPVTAPLLVTLTCEDRGGSGCATTYYTTDGTTPTTSSPSYSAPTSVISIMATTTLKFFSVDAKGNTEAVKSETYTFHVTDTTAPTVSASPAGGSYNAVQTVTLACNDGSGTGCQAIRYTTDGSTPTPASAQYTAPLTVNANTTLQFFATDVAGNASAVVTEIYVITIDSAPPTVTATPAGGVYNTPQLVTLACDDNSGSGCASVRYTTDGSTPTISSAEYTAPLSISANTALKFLGVDNAGNFSAVRTETYVIDAVAPTVAATPRGGTYTTARNVSLSCTDAIGCASIRYTTDGSTPTAASAQYTSPIAIAANTTLRFIGIDNAGNTSAVSTETYVIDTVAPTVAASPTGGTYNSAQSVTLSCNDGTGSGCASIRYTTDGSTPTASSTQYSAALSIAADTTLKFIGIDDAGNVSPVVTETYVIDTVAPTVAANPTGGTYNSARSVSLSCNDGAGSGCASIRYTTDGSTPTAASAQYTNPLSIAASTTLKFIGIDNAGNASAVATETYVIDTTPPTVTANPPGGPITGSVTVTLSCNDGTGTGCASVRYTTDGSTPTAASAEYSAALTFTATTTLKFIGIDNAGNESAVFTETYVADVTPPTTTANPPGGVYGPQQTVTLTCNDGTGVGCAATYYTVDGTTPTTNSPQYTGPVLLSVNTTLRFFSVDSAGNAEAVKTQQYFIGTAPADTSAQIAAVRAAAFGAINLPIRLALVTYLKPAVGTDAPGFFLQAEQAGPAVFIAVNPATLTPVPMVGDRVSLVATQKANPTNVGGMVHVTAISGFVVEGRGESVEPLRAEVSTIDLPANLANYESELISVSGTLRTPFTGSGTAHVSSNLGTVATPNGTNVQLRLPTTLQEQLDLSAGCNVTVQSPLWRFTTAAQPSAYTTNDITVLSCPAPKVLSATAISPTSVRVRFDRRIDPASVQADGSQFTFNNGLSAIDATPQTREVLLNTVAQTGGQSYTVAVAPSVRDTRGTSVDATANTATFAGYQAPATLRITEVAANISNGRDLVELYVVQGGNVGNFTLVLNTSTVLATLPNVQVATGDVIVVHLAPDAATNGDAPTSETTSKNQYPQATYAANYNTAWDFHGGTTDIGFSSRVLRVRDALGTTQDGVSFARTGVTPPTSFPTDLQSLQAEGQWLPVNCGGVPCTAMSTPTAAQVSAPWENSGTTRTGNTTRRVAGDNHIASDWAVGANSLGSYIP
ncbi:MAG TPA: chitobiase/beta-hexosaminidase C-terminal domain-containing protein [Myxococcaceae bacterium]|nr:chitobiase/beta-hexosaminidase C-terminal domain-containing protein [Myxococcaceae bacterium]